MARVVDMQDDDTYDIQYEKVQISIAQAVESSGQESPQYFREAIEELS